MFSFSQPFWLLSTHLLLYLLWRIQRESYEEASSVRKIFWLFVRSIVLLLMILTLAGLQYRTETRKNQVLFLVDHSDSIIPEQREIQLELLNQSIRRIHSPDQVGVVVFGADAAVERFPSAPHLLQNIDAHVEEEATN